MYETATHKSPVWETKANFLIRADLSQNEMKGHHEQIWAKKINDYQFVICCIPFFTYGISLGDIVQTDNDYIIQNKILSAGHRTLRIAVANKAHLDQLHISIHEWAENTNFLYEWYASGYLAIDLPPNTHLDISFLEYLEQKGELSFEIDEQVNY
jgi:hypothetical protein